MMEAKELQDLIDTADCNAEVNFTKTKGGQGVLGWARRLIEVSFKAGHEQGLEEAPHLHNQCKLSYKAGYGDGWTYGRKAGGGMGRGTLPSPQ